MSPLISVLAILGAGLAAACTVWSCLAIVRQDDLISELDHENLRLSMALHDERAASDKQRAKVAVLRDQLGQLGIEPRVTR